MRRPLRPIPARRRLAVGSLAVVVGLGVVACSDGDDEGAGDATTSSTTAADLLLAGDPALVGRWTNDAGAFVASSLGEGLDVPPTCEAESVLEFGADGSFSTSTMGRCEFAEGAGDVVIEAEGTYGAASGTVEIRDLEGRSVLVGDDGEEVPIRGSSLDDGELPYVVEGDVLELGDAAAGGTLSYRRG
jgi:hypothetical protein